MSNSTPSDLMIADMVERTIATAAKARETAENSSLTAVRPEAWAASLAAVLAIHLKSRIERMPNYDREQARTLATGFFEWANMCLDKMLPREDGEVALDPFSPEDAMKCCKLDGDVVMKRLKHVSAYDAADTEMIAHLPSFKNPAVSNLQAAWLEEKGFCVCCLSPTRWCYSSVSKADCPLMAAVDHSLPGLGSCPVWEFFTP
jgi:hypothetical protein